MGLLRFNALLLLLLASVQLWADVKEARVWDAPDGTRLVFELTRSVEHKIFTLENPNRLVIDMINTRLTKSGILKHIAGNTRFINKIRSAKQGKRDLRVVLDLSQPVVSKSFNLKATNKLNHRLVIDLSELKSKKSAVVKTISQVQKNQRDIIIAIDAGHGGEDPGAIGHRKNYEKHVVLSIARKLAQRFKAEKGFKPYLVRNGDYYIGLRKRTKLAREAKSDLFISIHADAFKNKQAHGSSVFTLSERGGTSEAARWLADKENSADLAGGVSLDDKNDMLAGVLLDLSMDAKHGASLKVGKRILNSMGRISHLHKSQVEQAGFMVLKSPDIPSVLIETGFISNPKEAKKLASNAYQQKMADRIFYGIKNYFENTPPPGSFLAYKKNKARKVTTYVIEKGDTLSAIAARTGTSIKQLRTINGLRSSGINVGQVIKIPAL